MLFYLTEETPIQCFNSGNLISRDGFLHQRRIMDCWVLIYVLSGTLNITTNGTEYAVSSGEWVILKKGAEHFGSKPSNGELSYLWTHFNPISEFLETTAVNPASAYILPEYGKSSSQRISVLFRQLLDNSRRELYTPRMAEYSLKLLLMEITQEYLDAQEKRSSLPPLISDMTEWLRLNCHRQLSIKEIAEEFHYNPEYLSYLFRKETGQTIIGYLNRCRVDLSKRLLSDRNVSIKEAAFSCGFNDEKYYLRIFRKLEGMTPKQYRTAIGAG